MIRFVNAGKAFRARRNKKELVWPIRHFTATILPGESTAILATEGAGKTTLIDLVAGTENPTEGEIIRTGHISWPASFRGMINPRMTARQNLRFLCDTYGHDFGAAHDFVQDFAELGRYMDLLVKQCSNEQRHRLAIAVLFAMNFEFILVDDTFEAGDAAFRRKVAQFIEDNSAHLTFFMATSSARLAERYCKHAGILTEGTVTFYDSMEEAVATFRRMKTEEDY
ncbi:MAG: ATP-binding cassette domain-containing protein [Rhizobium sp.]|nr:ATP-binding cassette domain-containing protein [Rhizobium sp.]